MAFQRRHDEHLDALPPHPRGHQLHGKALARAAGAQDGDVGVLVDVGIKDIHDDEGVVVLVHAQQDAVIIAHLIAGVGVAACRPQGEDVALGTLKEVFLQRNQGQGGQKSLLLAEGTGLYVHVLRQQQLFHLGAFPFQLIHAARRDGNQEIEVIEVLVVPQAVLQEVSATDGPVQIVEVGVGVAGFPDLAPIDAQLLAQLADHAVFGLAGEEHVQVDAVPGVHQQGQPSGGHLGLEPIRRHQQIGVVHPVDADVPPMGEVDLAGGVELVDRNAVRCPSRAQVFRHHLFGFVGERVLVALPAAEDVVENFRRCFILFLRHNHCVAALAQVVGGGAGGGLEGGDGFILLLAPLGARHRLMLENEEEPPGDGLPGAQIPNQLQIVLLEHPAVGVGLPGQLLPHTIHMAVNVRPLG